MALADGELMVIDEKKFATWLNARHPGNGAAMIDAAFLATLLTDLIVDAAFAALCRD
jgi:hypothetical protein